MDPVSMVQMKFIACLQKNDNFLATSCWVHKEPRWDRASTCKSRDDKIFTDCDLTARVGNILPCVWCHWPTFRLSKSIHISPWHEPLPLEPLGVPLPPQASLLPSLYFHNGRVESQPTPPTPDGDVFVDPRLKVHIHEPMDPCEVVSTDVTIRRTDILSFNRRTNQSI